MLGSPSLADLLQRPSCLIRAQTFHTSVNIALLSPNWSSHPLHRLQISTGCCADGEICRWYLSAHASGLQISLGPLPLCDHDESTSVFTLDLPRRYARRGIRNTSHASLIKAVHGSEDWNARRRTAAEVDLRKKAVQQSGSRQIICRISSLRNCLFQSGKSDYVKVYFEMCADLFDKSRFARPTPFHKLLAELDTVVVSTSR